MIIEGLLYILIVLAIILKIAHFEGALLLLVVGLAFLAMLYFLFSFILLNKIPLLKLFNSESYIDLSWLQIIISLVWGLVFSILPIAILFKLMNWEGGQPMLLTGLILSAPLLVLILILKRELSLSFLRHSTIRGLILIFAGLALYF